MSQPEPQNLVDPANPNVSMHAALPPQPPYIDPENRGGQQMEDIDDDRLDGGASGAPDPTGPQPNTEFI
ncbi:hypothetical protein AAF712_008026 [Marasmius tenuissimus]|uniref:Uncharacterized protein n=1 Tax=Marasmius tenuissimus TaxID=585030 RepID=A0ABR2ZUE7_9AGAR